MAEGVWVGALPFRWDFERSLCGAKLNYSSIQVGIGRQLIKEYNNSILFITDLTPLTHKIYDLKQQGKLLNAKNCCPAKGLYPVATDCG